MLGFPKQIDNHDTDDENTPRPWGRITCGGSIANTEAIWAARNLKFYPLSLFKAIAHSRSLEFVRDTFEISLCSGENKLLKNCSTWELLNLRPETILEIPYRLEKYFDITANTLTNIMKPFLVQTVGIHALESEFGITEKPAQFIAGATKHYSLPKGCALAGVGSDNLIDIPVDISARMDISALDRHLNSCLERQQPVYAVIAIMGSTDHGGVDPLAEICDLRKSYQLRGMSFVIHADAAWGGYFASLLRQPTDFRPFMPDHAGSDQFVPERSLSDYVTRQFLALSLVDSVTVDPHKSGYVPYPAGGLCYRDGRMRYQLTWFNPSGHGSADPEMSLSVFGMEGSKSGAAAAAVWLSNITIGLHKDGYGMLLSNAMFGALKMYSHLATMDMDSDLLQVIPLVMLPAEKENATHEVVLAQKRELIHHIRDKPNEDITRDDLQFASSFGSDLSTNSFACNFWVGGQLNADIAEANYLNQRIYERLSITKVDDDIEKRPLIIMLTEVNQNAYGICAKQLKRRLGLVGEENLKILVNCVMSPFPTTSDFTKTIAMEFRGVAEDVIQKYSLHRNTVTPARFYFMMQGTDQVHLVLLPSFHMENHRRQLVLACELSSAGLYQYRAARAQEAKQPLVLYNRHHMTLEELLKGGFEADVILGLPQKSTPIASNIIVTSLKVVKNHRLNSRFLDKAPPLSIFYLYGTPEQMHIEHALLCSENVQLTSEQVTLELIGRDAICSEELSNGLVVVFRDMHEQNFLPVLPPRTPSSFRPGRTHRVFVYRDLTDANAAGRDVFGRLISSEPIGTGNLTLGDMTFADSTLINLDPWRVQDDGYTGGPKQRPHQLAKENYGAVHEMHRKSDRRTEWENLVDTVEADYFGSFGDPILFDHEFLWVSKS
ncbi:Thiol:disulfide interchange protein DsbD [Rhizoctonia solani]|uniref:Thiol:disulfide interchange protein DsbD n=1 Tax=Rhizoctonia solani TaxID=456999 RepID=A0A0K6G3W4_9AGAM|nr:unnamed protein product [Rhizoctonia solani]CUA73048.1 Thiol:disulfide interchange protein DsbD [Rhizoctonia solani]